MPEIFGFFGFKGGRISDFEIRTELDALKATKKPEIETWSDKSVGLAEENANAQIEFSLPSTSAYKLSIVSDACLTNRTELFNEFGVLPSKQRDYSDKHLILRAFEKWGEDCVEHLNGDFAFAIWDKKHQRLFCARDHLGKSGFFYYTDNEKFVFASTPSGILRFGGIEERLNKNKLAIFLLPEPHTLTIEESWFKDISPLAAGTVLTVDPHGVKKRRYWKPELKESLPYKKNEEILLAFREMMFEIIGSRLKDSEKITAFLSGGLDSSSIVSIAARILEKRNKEITVFSGVLPDKNDPEISDEREYIDQFQTFENVRIKYVSAEGKGPFSDLEGFFEHHDNPQISSRHYLQRACSEFAKSIGSNTILDGALGEFGASFNGEGGFAEMFKKFKWLTLWRELRLRKSLYGESVKYNFRANTLNPLLPDFLIRLRHGNSEKLAQLNQNHPLESSFYRDLLKKTDIPMVPAQRPSSDHRVNQLSAITFLFEKVAEFTSAGYGNEPVEFRYPLLDKRLLEFSLSVPLDLKIRDGYTRYLIRAGLNGIIPPAIQWRTSKTPYSPDYIRRYQAQTGRVKQMLSDIRSNDPLREILDIAKIRGWVDSSTEETAGNSSVDIFSTHTIPQAIYLIYFLRRFSEFRI